MAACFPVRPAVKPATCAGPCVPAVCIPTPFPHPPQENKHFEDAFQAYERGVALFKYPHSRDIWVAYLAKFVARYGGRKLERARDLFRHALREVGSDL